MIVEQIIKTLNSTELGLKGANERYAQCRQLECLKDWHEDADAFHKISFIDKKTGVKEKFNIYFKGQKRGEDESFNRENRIAGNKNYFITINNLTPGDEILFEKVTDLGTNSSYFVDVKKNEHLIVFQNTKKSLEVLNFDRLNDLIKSNGPKFRLSYELEDVVCDIKFLGDNNCILELTKNNNTKVNISSIPTDYLLKLDLAQMKLIQYDPLIYSRFEY